MIGDNADGHAIQPRVAYDHFLRVISLEFTQAVSVKHASQQRAYVISRAMIAGQQVV